jgi:hypothetical protein
MMPTDQIMATIIGLLQIAIALLGLWQNHVFFRSTNRGKHGSITSKVFALLILPKVSATRQPRPSSASRLGKTGGSYLGSCGTLNFEAFGRWEKISCI